MSFAEQLAARAAETRKLPQNPNETKQEQPQPQQRKPQRNSKRDSYRLPYQSPPLRPPRPTISNRGGASAVRNAINARSLSQPFEEQLRRSSGSLNKLSATRNRQSFQQQQQQVESASVSPPLDNANAIYNDNSSRVSSANARREAQHRATLIPPLNDGHEEEEDEYASVGFSLTDNASATATMASILADKEEDDHTVDNERRSILAEREESASEASFNKAIFRPTSSLSLGGEESYQKSTSKIVMGYSPASELGGSSYKTTTASIHDDSSDAGDSSPSRLQRERSSNTEQRQQSSPLVLQRGGTLAQPLVQQEIDSSVLQSKLKHQILKCQPPPSESLMLHTQTSTVSADNNTTTNDSQSCISKCSRRENNNNLFGAWAQIESLQRRCLAAEDRARQECRRAEVAIFEKNCLIQKKYLHQQGVAGRIPVNDYCQEHDQSASQECNEQSQSFNEQSICGSQGHGCSNDWGELDQVGGCNGDDGVSSSYCETLTNQAVEMPVRANERKITGAPQIVDVIPNSAPTTLPQNTLYRRKEDSASSSSSIVGPRDNCNDAAALHSWKQRALEAEERLAMETKYFGRCDAALSNKVPSPDLIRLKNAEIDVLRSQIHRLERRINEECERNSDLVLFCSRSSVHSYLPDCNGDVIAPPLVVSPTECVTSSNSYEPRNTEAEKFCVLRNEIRQLQYQLRTIQNNNVATTVNSTLSSLEYDNDQRGRGDGEEERMNEEDIGSSSSSLWGLCCVRGRSRRGYGRVG